MNTESNTERTTEAKTERTQHPFILNRFHVFGLPYSLHQPQIHSDPTESNSHKHLTRGFPLPTLPLSVVLKKISKFDPRFQFAVTRCHTKNTFPKLQQISFSPDGPKTESKMNNESRSIKNAESTKNGKFRNDCCRFRNRSHSPNDTSLTLTVNDHPRFATEFRYLVKNAKGLIVFTGSDLEKPIFSEQSPIIQSGFSIQIDLFPRRSHQPPSRRLIARKAVHQPVWMADSQFILDL